MTNSEALKKLKNIDNELNEEYLAEMATVYRDSNYNILVSVNPDRKHTGQRYFKFYNALNYESATKVSRISFDAPICFTHKNSDGKENWYLNSKDKKKLIEILQKDSNKYTGCDVWTTAKFDWNNECLDEILNLDKYLSGEYDTLFKSDIRYVPLSLKMPDYTKLP